MLCFCGRRLSKSGTDFVSRPMKRWRVVPPVKVEKFVCKKGGNVMPNDDFAILCPYYYKVLGNDLFCEGMCGDENIPPEKSFFKQCFENRAKRNAYLKRYCSSFRYHDCRMAALNELLSEAATKREVKK